MANSKKSLRLKLKEQCRAVPLSLRRQKSEALLTTVGASPLFEHSQHIAFYWPLREEIDPGPLFKQALRLKKRCYLPMLDPLNPNHLLFIEYKPGDTLTSNRYGIMEPCAKGQVPINAWQLDLVLIPLLAFTEQGVRLGKGGGYYDRTFAFTRNSQTPKVPILIGLAYDLQCLPALPSESWDIPMAGIGTETRLILSSL